VFCLLLILCLGNKIICGSLDNNCPTHHINDLDHKKEKSNKRTVRQEKNYQEDNDFIHYNQLTDPDEKDAWIDTQLTKARKTNQDKVKADREKQYSSLLHSEKEESQSTKKAEVIARFTCAFNN
jgi:hypothetical protein